jgi:hypothetical protein
MVQSSQSQESIQSWKRSIYEHRLENYRDINMSDKKREDADPPGEPAVEILDRRIWIDGCFDFFHQ